MYKINFAQQKLSALICMYVFNETMSHAHTQKRICWVNI